MPEFASLPVEDLTAIWERQAQKLVESGVPRERVADSLRIAALNFESRTLSLAARELMESFRARSERPTEGGAVSRGESAAADAPAEDNEGRGAGAG
jgi:hypothetical protein